MSESNIPENFLPFMSPRVAVNGVLFAGPRYNAVRPACCNSPDYRRYSPTPHGHLSRDRVRPPAHGGLLRDPEGRGARPGPDGRQVHPAPSWQGDTRGGECSCWNCRSNQWGTTDAPTRDSNRQEDGSISQAESDEEEELEAPLPLRDEHEWDDFNPSRLPHRFMHTCDGGHDAGEGQFNHSPANTYFTPPHQHFAVNQQHRRRWDEPRHCLQLCDGLTHGAVSVNVPQFSVPPAEGMSQVSVLKLAPAGGNSSTSHPQERRRTISLPEECRKVFITYSSDVSSEVLSFVDFLAKQGLRPAIDLLDDPVRNMDINTWNDSNLKDPLTLIIIAISPKYKADIEGSVMDSKALHNKYVHSMMQNEFIQQGSLNFRFIPVLFLGASQKFVPTWLQNTRVYRWPQDTEDLSLRLLREERYVPPPVPVDLTLLITPVTSGATSAP